MARVREVDASVKANNSPDSQSGTPVGGVGGDGVGPSEGLSSNPLQAATDVLGSLDTTVRAFRLYDITNEGCQIQLRHLEQNINDYCRAFHTLEIKLTYKEVFLCDHPDQAIWVWDGSDSALLHRLYMDGIQELQMRPGIGREELVDFLKILSADYNSYYLVGEDVASMLWKAELKNISHKTLEGFEYLETVDLTDRQDQEKVEAALAQFTSKIFSPNLSQAGLLNQPIVTGDKQPPKIENTSYPLTVASCNTARGKLLFIESTDLQRLDHALQEDRQTDFLAKVLQALFEVLEIDRQETDIGILLNYFLLVADELLNRHQWQGLSRLLVFLNDYVQNSVILDERLKLAVGQTLEQLSSENRIKKIETFLLASEDLTHIDDLTQYLSSLSPKATLPLLKMAFDVPSGAVRRLLLTVLGNLGKGQEFLFFDLIEKVSNEDLPDLVFLLSQFDLDKVEEPLIQMARDCTGTAREKALVALLPSQEASVKTIMTQTLHKLSKNLSKEDPALKVTIQYFVKHQDASAALELKKFTQEKDFGNLPEPQQVRYFSLLGEIGQQKIIPYLEKLLHEEHGLFGKKAHEIKKFCVVNALAKINDDEARRILKEEGSDSKNSSRIRSRCRGALSAGAKA